VRERLARYPTDYAALERDTTENLHHRARELTTAGLVAWPRPETVVDPAAGEGNILALARKMHPFRAIVGDISLPNFYRLREVGGWEAIHQAPAEETIRRAGFSDMIVLTEILEHLEDPDAMLRLAREHAHMLVASSPEMRPFQADDNPQHLWKFDGDGYREMLEEAGWVPYSKTHLTFRPRQYQEDDKLMVEIGHYDFQIWVCGRG
jgi:hypothetical protein